MLATRSHVTSLPAFNFRVFCTHCQSFLAAPILYVDSSGYPLISFVEVPPKFMEGIVESEWPVTKSDDRPR